MERILIKNFKAIVNKNEIEIPIKNLNIFIGEQASGKSTIAKLIYFFKTIREEILSEVLNNSQLANNNFTNEISKRVGRYFVYLFGSSRHLANFEVKYYFANDKWIKIEKNWNSGNVRVSFDFSLQNSLQRKIIPISTEYHRIANQFDDLSRRERERVVNGLANYLKGREAFQNPHHHLYMPASRNMTVILESHLTDIYARLENIAASLDLNDNNNFNSDNELLLLKFMQYVRNMKSKFKKGRGFKGLIEEARDFQINFNEILLEEIIKKIEELIKGKYNFDEYGEKIQFSNSINDYVYLPDASSGQQEIIRPFQDIFLSILYDDTVFRVYEEPESHLFPLGQKGYIELIAMLINANPQNQIVIPTHSPYILTALDNLIKAKHIAKQQPEQEEEVNQIVPRSQWLDLEQIGVYALKDGEIYDSLDRERQGLQSEVLDDTTEKMSATFDQLLNLQYQSA
jgi:hypothetical protein